MPLTKRQKRRLLEVSKMIESTLVVKDDMVEIQKEYASEIDEVIELIRLGKTETKHIGDSSTDLSLYENQPDSDSQENSKSTNEHQSESNFEPPEIPAGPDAPEWAKRLWKQIAKQCHPDRLSFQELNAIEISRRQTWFLEARNLFETQQWNKLLHIGVQLGEYIDDLSAAKQLEMLNMEYSSITNKLQDVQKSLAWSWGTNWDNLELRIKIITVCVRAKGIKVPPKIELIKILVNLETE